MVEDTSLLVPEPSGLQVLDPAMLTGQLALSSIAQYRADLRHYAQWARKADADPLGAAPLARYRAALANDS